MNEKQLYASGITKSYKQGQAKLDILRGVNFELYRGDAVSIIGRSGAGKSTFLHILGTLDRPDQGELRYRDTDLLRLSDQELAKFRNEKLGFVFQFHHLLSEFSALENVMMPNQIAGATRKEAELRAEELLEMMGMLARGSHYPSELSGGELQRVAIARALARKPEILLADEPTGNLDSKTSRTIQDLFFALQEQLKISLVVVTHDKSFAERFSRQFAMRDGAWYDPASVAEDLPKGPPPEEPTPSPASGRRRWF